MKSLKLVTPWATSSSISLSEDSLTSEMMA